MEGEGPRSMVSQRQPVGSCPECGADIPSYGVIIEYETDDGMDMFAECIECGEVVHPAE